MKRYGIEALVVALTGWLLVTPTQAWMISVDAEQLLAADQNNFEIEMDGHVRPMGGGKDPATNAFVLPNMRLDTDSGAPPAYPYTLVRFLGISPAGTKAVISNSPGVKRQFGIFGDGPRVPVITEVRWGNDCTVPVTAGLDLSTCLGVGTVPATSVQFAYDPVGDVIVTLVNQTTQNVRVSQVGYRILKINSFRLEDLNRTHMPPAAFTSAAASVPDGTLIPALGGSTSFTVTGVTLDDDVVVYLQSDFDPAPIPANPGGMWVAWHSGTYIPSRPAYLGRVTVYAVNSAASSRNLTSFPTLTGGTENAVHTDLMAKLPLKAITVVGDASPGKYFGYLRAKTEPGAVGLEATKNGSVADLLLSTTTGADLKRSYLRTSGQDVYADVRVQARVLPGASDGTTLDANLGGVINSIDRGGPIAIRISPTGDSYFASILTANPTQIDLVKEINAIKTVIATTGAGGTWDNGDPIQIDRTDPVPMPAPPNAYHPKVYDVALQAVGNVISLTVREIQNSALVTAPGGGVGHVKTLTVVDTDLTRGYVGVRTERNGSIDGVAGDANNGDKSSVYETMVRNFVIEDPNATYAGSVALGQTHSTQVDAPANATGTLGTERSDSVVSDNEIGQLAFRAGFEADFYNTTFDMDHYTERGAYTEGCSNPAGCTYPAGSPANTSYAPLVIPFGQTVPFFEQPLFNSTYDLYWQSGTSGGATTHHGTPLLDIPAVIGEHVIAGERNCEQDNGINHHALDTCMNTQCTPNPAGTGCADARAGMYVTNSGDYRGGDSIANPWGGDLYLHPDGIRILQAAGDPTGTNGDPTHPLVAGLGDASGVVKVYAFPWRHMMSAGNPAAPGSTILAVETNSTLLGAPDGGNVINGHRPWGLIATPTGTARLSTEGANNPNPNFPANNVFFFAGDHTFHRLSCEGREIARRSLYWAMGLPIPPSPFLYFGDFDEDGDVDNTDQGHLAACLSGAGVPLNYENGCADADSDGDGDVDANDSAAFTACAVNGAGVEPPSSCPCPQISIPGPPTFVVTCARAIVGRHVFYNNSFYDTPSTACNNTFNGGQPCDDNSAVAPNVIALLPGQAPLNPGRRGPIHGAQVNYSNYLKGINGIMVDVQYAGCAALPAGALTAPQIASTFEFVETVAGNSGRAVNTAYTGAVRVPTSVTVAPHPTLANTDRITIIFADDTSANSHWLRTRVLTGGAIDGLAGEDRFYFGLAKADGASTSGTNVLTNNIDVDGPKPPNNHTSLSRAPIDDVFDYDRNSLVNNVDGDAAKAGTGFGTSSLNCLQLTGVAP